MKRAGITPVHFANILRRLDEALGGTGEHGLQYLASHPPTRERIRRFERE